MAHNSVVRPAHSGPLLRACGAGARIIILAAVVLFTAAGLGAFWLYRSAHPSSAGTDVGTVQSSPLSESTMAVLAKLDSPLQIRFYSILDPATVPENVSAFSSRADELLSAYEQAANGNVKITRLNAQSNLRFTDAPADGIQPFNLDKGEACYLGIALEYKGRREFLPRLLPEWEQALEPDLTRAIARLEDASRPVPAPVAISQVNTAAVQEVKALIPDVSAVSLEEGKKIIQEAAVKELAAASKEMEAARTTTLQQLAAQANASETEREAARKQLQQLQTQQAERLKQIAAKSQAQIQAFQQLKAAQ